MNNEQFKRVLIKINTLVLIYGVGKYYNGDYLLVSVIMMMYIIGPNLNSHITFCSKYQLF